MRAYPGATILPMAAVQIPLTVLTAMASLVLYATVFNDLAYPDGGLVGAVYLGNETGRPLVAMVMVLAVNLLFGFVALGATTIAIAGTVRGKPPGISQSLDPAFTRMGALLSLALLFITGSAALLFSIVGILFLPLFLALMLGLAPNCLMLETLRPMQAIARSWQMTQGNKLRLVAVFSMAFVLSFVLVSVAASIPVFLVQALGLVTADSGRTTRMIADTVLSTIGGVIAIPFVVLPIAVTTLFYLDLKARNDVRNPS